MTKNIFTSWRPYFPAFNLGFLAMFFWVFPFIAAFLLSGLLMMAATLYAWIVFQTLKTRSNQPQRPNFYQDIGDPTFRNISEVFVKRSTSYKDVTP